MERAEAADLAEERRRVLHLTRLGARIATAEARRLSRLVRVARDYELLEEADA